VKERREAKKRWKLTDGEKNKIGMKKKIGEPGSGE
jgi:hypothetical protein